MPELNVDEIQISGDHYKPRNKAGELAIDAQHWNEILKLGYGHEYYTAQNSKYWTRWRKKNGLPDLIKGRHFVEKLLSLAESRGSKFLPYGHVKAEADLQAIIGDHMQSHLRYYFEVNEVDPQTAAAIILVTFANSADMLKQAIVECNAIEAAEQVKADVNTATLNTQLPVSALFDFKGWLSDDKGVQYGIRWTCKRCHTVLDLALNQPPGIMHKTCNTEATSNAH